jgi:hypothetical protein
MHPIRAWATIEISLKSGGNMSKRTQRVVASRRSLLLGVTATIATSSVARAQAADPLASWNEGPAKQAILNFVRAVGQVPPEDRIAAFDQDGTLWVEHPAYCQAVFAIERVHTWPPSIQNGKVRSRSKQCSPMTRRRSRSSRSATGLRSSSPPTPG